MAWMYSFKNAGPMPITHWTPMDFTATYLNSNSITTSLFAVPVDDSVCTIGFIYYKPLNGQWQEPLINGFDGVSITAVTDVVTVHGAGNPFATGDLYVVGLLYDSKVGGAIALKVQGDVAHDDPDAGNPVKIGGKAYATTPVAVDANDRVNAYFDPEGYQHNAVKGEQAHGDVIASDPIIVGEEAIDFDGVAFAAVAAGQLTRLKASLSGVQFVMPTTKDGAASPIATEDEAHVAALNAEMIVGTLRSDVPTAQATITDHFQPIISDANGQVYAKVDAVAAVEVQGAEADDAPATLKPVLVAHVASDFDGAVLPTVSNEGDVASPAVTLNRVPYAFPVNATGAKTPLKETNVAYVDADIISTLAVRQDTLSATIGGGTPVDGDYVPLKTDEVGQLRTRNVSIPNSNYKSATTGGYDGTVTYLSAATLTLAGTPFTPNSEDLVYIKEVDATANTAYIWVNGMNGVQFEISAGVVTKTGGKDFSVNGVYELGYNGQEKSYVAATNAKRTTETSPIDTHYSAEELVDSAAVTTIYLPSIAGDQLGIYNAISIQIGITGTATITVEASLDDAAFPDFVDITRSAINTKTGNVGRTSFTNETAMLIVPMPYRLYRVYVAVTGSVPVQVHVKKIALPIPFAPMNTPNASADARGCDLFFDADGDNTAQALKASAGNLYGVHIINLNAVDCYVQLFNLATVGVTPGVTVPNYIIFVPASGAVEEKWAVPMRFSIAISYVCSTGPLTAVDPTTGLIISATYK